MVKYLILFIFAYLIGSFPSGYIFYKIKTGEDLRVKGKRKNTGTTNAFLCGGKHVGIFTLIFDILKGFIPVFIAYLYFPNHEIIIIWTGLMCILGHIFPIYIRFHGGTGLATALGGLIVLYPDIMFIFLLLFLLLLPILKRPAFIGMILMISFPILTYIFNYSKLLISISVLMGLAYVLISLGHIKDILKGVEYKETEKLLFD